MSLLEQLNSCIKNYEGPRQYRKCGELLSHLALFNQAQGYYNNDLEAPHSYNGCILHMLIRGTNVVNPTPKYSDPYYRRREIYNKIEDLVYESSDRPIYSRLNQLDSDGKAPLHYACEYGDSCTLSLLNLFIVDHNIKDIRGNTPLMYILRKGDPNKYDA